MSDEIANVILLNAHSLPKGCTQQISFPVNAGPDHFAELIRVLNNIKDEGQDPFTISHTCTESIIVIFDKRRNWDRYY